MICSKCGYVALDGDVFCIKCGNPLKASEPAAPETLPVPEADEAVAETIEESAAADVPFESEEVSFEDTAETVTEAFDVAEEAEEIVEAVPAEDVKMDLFAVKAPKPEEAAPAPQPEPEPCDPIAEEEPSEAEPVFDPDPDAQINDEPEDDEEADVKPERTSRRIITRIERPLSVWGFIWRTIVFAIPVVNIIPLFVLAFAPGINKNSKNYASAVLILLLIGLIIAVILGFLVFTTTDSAVLHDFILKYFKISI